VEINIRNSCNGEILEAQSSDSGRIEGVLTLKSVLQNGYVDGILETRYEDSRAETRSCGFGTRRANGSFRITLNCRHRNLGDSPQKELVTV